MLNTYISCFLLSIKKQKPNPNIQYSTDKMGRATAGPFLVFSPTDFIPPIPEGLQHLIPHFTSPSPSKGSYVFTVLSSITLGASVSTCISTHYLSLPVWYSLKRDLMYFIYLYFFLIFNFPFVFLHQDSFFFGLRKQVKIV